MAVAAAVAVWGASPPARAAQELLYGAEGNNLRRFDTNTIGTDGQREQVLIQRAGAAEDGGASYDPESRFRDVNGMTCTLPGLSGRFVAGEDTGQPNPPAGWGVFDPGGTQVGKLTPTYQNAAPEPFGCAFDAQGRLFTSDIGDVGASGSNGQLTVWFPPFDHFPGPAGAYPNTNATSSNFCKIAVDIGNASGVAVDQEGRVYVASPSGLVIRRFLPPFPDSVADCSATDPQGSPMASVQEEIFAAADVLQGMLSFTGLAFSARETLYAASVATGRIGEYDQDGNLLRLILAPPLNVLPPPTGTPQGLAVGADGTLYYADLDLVGTFPNLSPGPDGKIRRIRFDPQSGDPLPPEIVKSGLRFPDGLGIVPGDLEPRNSPTYGGNLARSFFQPLESIVTPDNVDELEVMWRLPTGAIITGQPAVATVDVGTGPTQVVYVLSWDGNVYAALLSTGSEIWRFTTDEQPGATFPYAASVAVERVNGQDLVFIGAGEMMYALDAVNGEEMWRFTAGTGCVDAQGSPPGLCGFDGERNEIESSAAVVAGLVLFGMDVNDRDTGKGGFYAVDAADGRLRWFFDLESGQVCTPFAGDDVRYYDPYHSEAELGLPAGFLSSRPGCDHPRTPNGCGNVWSSPAVDVGRGLVFFASSNCDTDLDPASNRPPPPMPPYDEALVALHLDGTPAWRWRPREVDNQDLAFGAPPNLFSIGAAGQWFEVVGVGNKDGTYYVIDRDGVNQATDVRWDDADPSGLPYWATQVVPGGSAGGIIGSASLDTERRRLTFATAPGESPLQPQQPTLHSLDMDTGAVVWDNGASFSDASFGPTSGIPGVVFQGSVLTPQLRFWRSQLDAGDFLGSVVVNDALFGSAVASAATASGGIILVGGGVGARSSNAHSVSDQTSRIPHDLVAFCVPGTPPCPEGTTCGLGFELALLAPLLARLRRARRRD
jgi:outer membrane protein assembly factor BamB